MAQQLHKFTMNTSLRNAMIFDDDSWECEFTPSKKSPFSDDSNSNETSNSNSNGYSDSTKTVIKRELFDDESHSPLKRAFNSIRIKQEDTPVKIKQEDASPYRTEDDAESSPPHRVLRSFEERIKNEEKNLFTRREQKGIFTRRAEEIKRQTLRSYKARMRNEPKNEGFKMQPGKVHTKFETTHNKNDSESSPKKQEPSAPYAFRSYSEKLKQNIDNSKGDSATQTWTRSTKLNRTKQQNSPNKNTETTNQRKQEGRKHALKRDLSRSSRDECVRKKRHIELETDEKVLQRRQRQIDFGKNTVAYDNYIKLIARNKRAQDDPATPNKYMKYSRRAWDGLIKQWRLRLHKYDP